MNQKLKYGLAAYLFGAAVWGAFIIQHAISNGGIERLPGKGPIDILIIAALLLGILSALAAAGRRAHFPQPIEH